MNGTEVPVVSILNQARRALQSGELDADVARSCGQPSARFKSEAPWAAILASARGANLQAWSRREEMSEPLYDKLAASRAPSLEESLAASYRELDSSESAARTLCTNCRIRPGFGPCPRCSGVGVLLVRAPGSETSTVDDCPDCADGFATCTVCDGTQRAVMATVRYVDRKPLYGQHLFVPEEAAGVAEVIGATYASTDEVPTSLAVSVDGDTNATAYRGAQGGRMAEFQGYRLGQTARDARVFLERVRSAPSFIVQEVRTFALPFVLAWFATPADAVRLVLFVDASGAPRFQRL